MAGLGPRLPDSENVPAPAIPQPTCQVADDATNDACCPMERVGPCRQNQLAHHQISDQAKADDGHEDDQRPALLRCSSSGIRWPPVTGYRAPSSGSLGAESPGWIESADPQGLPGTGNVVCAIMLSEGGGSGEGRLARLPAAVWPVRKDKRGDPGRGGAKVVACL